MKKCLSLLLSCVLVALLAGCAWMGKTAGKAQAKIERGANEMEQGYNQGYKQEKAKEGKTEQPSDEARAF